MAGISCLVLLLVASLAASLHSRKEGVACIQANGVRGVCTGVRRCRGGVMRIFSSVSRVDYCSYGHDGPVICCPRMTSHMMMPIAADQQSARSQPAPTPPQPDSQEIARKKCAEYAEYAYVTIQYETLLVEPEFVRVLKCSIVAEELIVGGKRAERHEFPHMAALGYVNQEKTIVGWKCAGSLISERFVLTAAHCTSDLEGSKVSLVRLGVLNVEHPFMDDAPQTIPVMQRIRHPMYKYPARYYDIALLKLERPAKLGTDVRPACLYTEQGDPPGYKYATATGWGLTNSNNLVGSDVLMKVSLELLPTEQCQTSHQRDLNVLFKGIVGDMMVCAGDPNGEKDTCMGDSGGPLQIRLVTPTCMYSIIGVTSFGSGECNSSFAPGVYSRVSHYIPWIQSHVWPSNT